MMTDGESDGKSGELAQVVAAACAGIGEPMDEKSVAAIIGCFAVITPPEYRFVVRMVRMNEGGRDGGDSLKPGNILLNMRQLVTAIAGGVLTVIGVVQMPWTAVFGALVLWDTLYAAAKSELSERDASVLWTLWLLRDSKETVADAGLLDAVNAERAKYGRNPITEQELLDALRRLVSIGSIKRSTQDKSRWWLREWVRVKYE